MQKKRNYTMAAALLTACLLAAGCGKSEQMVVGEYYHPSRDAAEHADTGEKTQGAPSDDTAGQTGKKQTAAGQNENEGEEASGTEQEEKNTLGSDQFLILSNDSYARCLTLQQIVSGREYVYYYSNVTSFLDKYGNRALASTFEPGRVVTVGKNDETGNVKEVRLSDKVWEYSDITQYSLDEKRGIFTIAGENYSYDSNVRIFSGSTIKNSSFLTDLDTLRVVGTGKKILSVAVTSGHGELALKNTELFEGSFIQIGSRMFVEITKDMSLTVPEGTHLVTVANNGYGGSTEITVEPGERTELDLDLLKGDGPKTGSILFVVDVEGAILQIDGDIMDYTGPISLRYGVHTLTVQAEGYETYQKKLFVNSPEATIAIGLSDGEPAGRNPEGGAKAPGENSADQNPAGQASPGTNTAPGSMAGSLAGSHAGGGTQAGANQTPSGGMQNGGADSLGAGLIDAGNAGVGSGSETDYLSTLSELLSTLSGNGN